MKRKSKTRTGNNIIVKRNKKINNKNHPKKNIVKRSFPFWPFGLFLFTHLLILDQYTKNTVLKTIPLGASQKVFSIISFTYVQNTGAIWGSLKDTNALLVWLSVIAFGVMIFFYDQFKTKFEKIAYTLLLVGLWGNMLDRVLHGFVIDFIAIGWWPVFNIADSCITIGIVIYLLEQWRQYRLANKAKA